MKNKITLEEFLENSLKEKAKETDYVATLWLACVEKFYKSEYNYDLGYNRGENKEPRKYRPGIVISKNKNRYKAIFFTTSYIRSIAVELKRCFHNACSVGDFLWKDKAYIFVRDQRSVFTINKEDMELFMKFCGTCNSQYIGQIKRYIYNVH